MNVKSFRFISIGLISLLLLVMVSIPLPGLAMAAPAGSTGLSAYIVATKNQVITGPINAAGYQIGVYVGPGVTGVVIKNAMIFGASDHGILIQDTSGIVVKNNEITGNGFTPTAGVASGKAVVLSGTKLCLIQNNNVHNNLGGGIEVTDDGPVSPAALNPGLSRSGVGNVITGNTITDNLVACGIVVSAWNPGEGVSGNLVIGNKVIITRYDGPYLGAIVIAADMPSTMVKDTLVSGNTITGGLLPGIIVHSNAPGDVVSGTVISFNTISNNGAFPPADPNDAQLPTGINIVAEAPSAVLTNSWILWNTVKNDYYGVWHVNDVNTKIIHLSGNSNFPIAP
jgi:parallel beta-helix repeat protein